MLSARNRSGWKRDFRTSWGFYLQNYPLHGKAAHSGKPKEQVSLIFWSPRLPQYWRWSADQNVRGEVGKLSVTWMVGWSPGSSTRDTDPIVAAQRLQGSLNCAAPAGTGWAGQLPGRGGGRHPPPPISRPRTWPTQLQVDARVAVLALWVSLLSAPPRDSRHLLEWRWLGCLCKARGAAASARASHGDRRAPPPWDLSQGFGKQKSAQLSPPPPPPPQRRGREAHAP